MLINSKEEEKLDPRIKRTRGLILQAFGSLLAEKDFESLSVQDITDRAQLNRGTFYLHFADKYALLDYVITQSFRQQLEKRMLNGCGYSPDNLKNMLLAVCEFHAQAINECGLLHQHLESLIEGPIKNMIFEVLSSWLKETGSELPTELPATVATWSIYGLASHYSHLKKRPALEKYVDEAFPLVAVKLERFA